MAKKLLPIHKIDFYGEDLEPNWYVMKVAYNNEHSYAETLLKTTKDMGLENEFIDVIIAVIEYTDVTASGRTIKRREKILPECVLIRMVMNNKNWSIARNTTGSMGWLNQAGDGRPYPMMSHEIEQVMKVLGREQERLDAQSAVVIKELEFKKKLKERYKNNLKEKSTNKNKKKEKKPIEVYIGKRVSYKEGKAIIESIEENIISLRLEDGSLKTVPRTNRHKVISKT